MTNPANLRPISTSSTTPLSFSMALWNCQSAVKKADFISAFSLQSTLSILGLTETWIRPEDSATPAALSNNLFRTFNSLLCPPPPPPTTSITADDFATFFTNKTKTVSSQFSPPLTQDPQPTRSTAQTPIFSFCPLTEAEVSKLLLSSHPTTCPLDPIPSHLL